MHDNSMVIMEKFVKDYDVKKSSVVDIGSYDINGNYRGLFKGKYIGVDIVAGPNVDVIMDSDEWKKLKDVDVAISGQTIEHIVDRASLLSSIFDILKPNGLLCIIAPSAGDPHYYPIFTGNVSKDEMEGLVTGAGFEIVSCTISDVPPFMDNCCIAKKPEVTKITTKKGIKFDANQ